MKTLEIRKEKRLKANAAINAIKIKAIKLKKTLEKVNQNLKS